ncbi:uncharacterized protein LOC104908349 [Beta vulgaris subsp. vulgaris]|uniref:uncharacterized protein LOC104908349 n=1 Tax=Beta vulgaris subsp. vulgaris TaxID=3555 RepID=UPI0005401557|nr:uncharacterized protein LOC104908349 [Beta vulgaris subsp. vulgaris]
MNYTLQQQESEARRKYMEMHEARISFIKQRVKQDWISSGDQNSRYFHACLRKRRIHNQICRIQDMNGVWQEKQENIEEAFIQYYKELLGKTYTPEDKVSKTIIKEGPMFDDIQRQGLCERFTMKDVKNAFWDIDDNKSPGPDGYRCKFFKEAWPCIGEDVSQAILNFFQSGKMLKQINATNLCLIPKIEQPINVS